MRWPPSAGGRGSATFSVYAIFVFTPFNVISCRFGGSFPAGPGTPLRPVLPIRLPCWSSCRIRFSSSSACICLLIVVAILIFLLSDNSLRLWNDQQGLPTRPEITDVYPIYVHTFRYVYTMSVRSPASRSGEVFLCYSDHIHPPPPEGFSLRGDEEEVVQQ